MTVTLADVAARARVSPATVSRVLNGNYPVAAATRERVMRAVDELDYVPNGPASSLAAATSDLVGILVNDIADPFFGIMAGAAQGAIGAGGAGDALTEAGRAAAGTAHERPTGTSTDKATAKATDKTSDKTSEKVSEKAGGEKLAVVCNTGGSPARELTYLTLLQRQRAAAVILTGGSLEDPEHLAAVAAKLARLAEAGTRVVLCGRPPLGEPPAGEPAVAATLAFDNRTGARRLTEHLLALGHRRIGYVAGPENRTTTRHRLEGHRAALAAAGVAEGPTVHGRYDRSSGYEATVELLGREPDLTAVVSANDTVALGVCAALRDRGLSIPGDVSVAGFDDLPFAVDAVPALTTVRLPLHDAGARAGRLALGTEAPPQGGVATIAAELVVRGSTGAPRGA
ncbi:LacI family DNA-binding transcriptional regulator [Streptomyces roseicoloratus]|uniref:LacI family DNA-binding transcriptional regulator n=1 Tax=Streptomyces roseicoloratus TaxID=2508722 RepID=UPI001009CDA9|nr:LacI family DNA-binding transcriptional regulator [Streptomyces roseicoloratus]